MAAVLCLIFLPLLAAVLFMFGAVSGHVSFGTIAGCLTFLLLGAGIFVGGMNMSKGWEGDPGDA
jgi:hypothetical protein